MDSRDAACAVFYDVTVTVLCTHYGLLEFPEVMQIVRSNILLEILNGNYYKRENRVLFRTTLIEMQNIAKGFAVGWGEIGQKY